MEAGRESGGRWRAILCPEGLMESKVLVEVLMEHYG